MTVIELMLSMNLIFTNFDWSIVYNMGNTIDDLNLFYEVLLYTVEK